MKTTNFSEYLIFGIFFIVGLFMIIGSTIFFNAYESSGKVGPINAVITDLRESGTSDEGTIMYRPYIEYKVDGQEYGKWLNVSSNTYRRNGIIEIYYSEDDPENVSVKLPVFVKLILYGMGIVFGFVGGFGLFKSLKGKLKKGLINTGKRVEAEITGVDYNRNYSVNGRHPLKVYCRFVDIDGNTYEFESENIWNNPNIDLNDGKMMPVYVDPNNYKKYYVNLEEYLNNI